jgi:hypothetical protein
MAAFILVALAHGTAVTLAYHGSGVVNPIISVFISDRRYAALGAPSFEALGALAIVAFLALAAARRVWTAPAPAAQTTLAALSYGAYALAVLHVILGAASGNRGHAIATVAGPAIVLSLHAIAAFAALARTGGSAR